MEIFAKYSRENQQIHIVATDFNKVFDVIAGIKEKVFDEIYLFKKYFNKLPLTFTQFICIYKLLIKIE